MDGICRSILLSAHFWCCAEKHDFGKTCRYLDSAGAQFMESPFIIPPFWHCLASLKDAFWNHISHLSHWTWSRSYSASKVHQSDPNQGDKWWWVLWVVWWGIAPDISHPKQWKLEIILVPLGTLPRPRGGGISMRLRDMWIRVVASVRALLPCTLYLGSKEMINIIESNPMRFHDNVDFQLWITCRSLIFVVVTCCFLSLAMQSDTFFFPKSGFRCVRNCRPVYKKSGVVDVLLRVFFSNTFNLANIIDIGSWTSSLSRLCVFLCVFPSVAKWSFPILSSRSWLFFLIESQQFSSKLLMERWLLSESVLRSHGMQMFMTFWSCEKTTARRSNVPGAFAMVLTDKRCDVGVEDEKVWKGDML